jgi:hypothetical protein
MNTCFYLFMNTHVLDVMDSNDSMKYRTRRNSNESNKWCPKCQTWIEKDLFYPNKSRYDGLSNYCRDCDDESRRIRAIKCRTRQNQPRIRERIHKRKYS